MKYTKTKLTLKRDAALADITVKNLYIQDADALNHLISQLKKLREAAILLNPANKKSQDD